MKAHDPIVTAAVAAITREAQQQALGSALYVEAVATQLAVHLLRNYAAVTFREPSGKGKLSPAQVRRLTEYIDGRLQEQLDLETLATVAGMGMWTFTRHFRRIVWPNPARLHYRAAHRPSPMSVDAERFADQGSRIGLRLCRSGPHDPRIPGALAHHAGGAAPLSGTGTVSFNKLPFSFKTRARAVTIFQAQDAEARLQSTTSAKRKGERHE